MSDEVSHEMQLEWVEPEMELDWTWMQEVDWPAFEAETSRQHPHTDNVNDGMSTTIELGNVETYHHRSLDEHKESGSHKKTLGPQPDPEVAQNAIVNVFSTGQGPDLGDDGTDNFSEQYRCTIDGCNYKSTFARLAELKRHVNTKHSREKPFVCTVSGCFKHQRAPAFARPDKLTAHIRAVHDSTKLTSCPNTACGVQLPLILLGIHARSTHHGGTKIEQSKRLAVHHGSDTSHTKWRYLQCGKKLRLQQFIDHVLSHSLEQQKQMEQDLKKLNYVFIRAQQVESSVGRPDELRVPYGTGLRRGPSEI
ncbi:hypothetical protein PRZ48_003143 [Zasmidium cellare]|uniref:C2H2-type domain-containing protein n=1 Tax=Zasmidium cellare TaxID=395010 RepID=A0ABR0EV93_ZASCE|nr:hypothetical protein PRZ48_003143 [Zasmidium cellare]